MSRIILLVDAGQGLEFWLLLVLMIKRLAMNTVMSPEKKEVMEAVLYRPVVLVIMPFEPKMCLKKDLVHSLELLAGKAEQELLANYPVEQGMLVMQKLRLVFKRLNFDTYKKSVAVCISPVFEKVFYLGFDVEERLLVNETFDIRELVHSKKQLHKYLVLLMSGKQSLMFTGNSSSLVRIVSNTTVSFYDPPDEATAIGSTLPDQNGLYEKATDKFLNHIDNVLDIILSAYRLPLFVLADKNIMGHFKALTKHAGAVIEYISGNFEEVGLTQLKKILEPHIADWKQVQQKDLMNLLEQAAGIGKLATGMKNVWSEAMLHKGRLLVVEENYRYVANPGSTDGLMLRGIEPTNIFPHIKNAMDEVMEKVLENGGDVEFVEDGLLEDYQQVALIQY